MGKLKHLFINLALIFASLTVGILILEVFFRFYIGHETHTVGGPAFRILDEEMNKLYLRDKEVPEGQFLILAIGDSFTYGNGIRDPQKTWPKQLQSMLNANLSRNISVVNAGLPGLNTVDELILFDIIKGYYKPNIVMIGYSVNDGVRDEQYNNSQVIYNYYADKAGPEMVQRYKDAKQKYAENLGEYKIRGLYGKVGDFLFTKSYLWFFIVTRYDTLVRKVTFERRYEDELKENFVKGELKMHLNDLKLLTEGIKSSGAIPIIVLIPYPIDLGNYPFSEGNERIKKLAEENDIAVIDPLPEFLGKDYRDLIVNKYDYHLNEKGLELLASYIYKNINESLIPP